MMTESLVATVMLPNADEAKLNMVVDTTHDTVQFYLDDEEIFSADWGANLMRLFVRALQLWFDWDQLIGD